MHPHKQRISPFEVVGYRINYSSHPPFRDTEERRCENSPRLSFLFAPGILHLKSTLWRETLSGLAHPLLILMAKIL